MDILERITELRVRKNWSIGQLAKYAGCKYDTIKNLYIRNNSPTIETLEKICSAFNISLSEFFSESTEVALTVEQKQILAHWNSISIEQKKSLLHLFISDLNI